MNGALTAEEQAQIYQTIEMFEVITQSQCDDYQSLEILKEAYAKLGRSADALNVSKKLVEAYYLHGQYSSALMECEGILQQEPDSPDIIAILGELEARLNISSPAQDRTMVIDSPQPEAAHLIPLPTARATPTSPQPSGDAIAFGDQPQGETFSAPNGYLIQSPAQSGSIALDYEAQVGGGSEGGLVRTISEVAKPTQRLLFENDGSEALGRQLIQLGVVESRALQPILERVARHNAGIEGMQMGASLILELSRHRLVNIEAVLTDFVTRARMAYVPLEYYEVDRQTARMLPPELSLHRLILPFDIISRTLLVALSNPLDAAGKKAVEQSVDFHVQWYLASPEAIQAQLTLAFKVEPPKLSL
jgi:hypothetical protein